MSYVTIKGLASFEPNGQVHAVEMDYHVNGVTNYIIDGHAFPDAGHVDLYWLPGHRMGVIKTEQDLSDIPF